ICALISFFFFQAEDGIRDATVTGVQTCALPICFISGPGPGGKNSRPPCSGGGGRFPPSSKPGSPGLPSNGGRPRPKTGGGPPRKIGRASGRERGEIHVDGAALQRRSAEK